MQILLASEDLVKAIPDATCSAKYRGILHITAISRLIPSRLVTGPHSFHARYPVPSPHEIEISPGRRQPTGHAHDRELSPDPPKI